MYLYFFVCALQPALNAFAAHPKIMRHFRRRYAIYLTRAYGVAFRWTVFVIFFFFLFQFVVFVIAVAWRTITYPKLFISNTQPNTVNICHCCIFQLYRCCLGDRASILAFGESQNATICDDVPWLLIAPFSCIDRYVELIGQDDALLVRSSLRHYNTVILFTMTCASSTYETLRH